MQIGSSASRCLQLLNLPRPQHLSILASCKIRNYRGQSNPFLFTCGKPNFLQPHQEVVKNWESRSEAELAFYLLQTLPGWLEWGIAIHYCKKDWSHKPDVAGWDRLDQWQLLAPLSVFLSYGDQMMHSLAWSLTGVNVCGGGRGNSESQLKGCFNPKTSRSIGEKKIYKLFHFNHIIRILIFRIISALVQWKENCLKSKMYAT